MYAPPFKASEKKSLNVFLFFGSYLQSLKNFDASSKPSVTLYQQYLGVSISQVPSTFSI
jgi:hypothetical protein